MKKYQGFTLLELMIVAAVMAILAMIAFPSYQNAVRKARRSDAKSIMMQAASAMEQLYGRTYSYASAVAGTTFPNQSPATGTSIYYKISLNPAPPTANAYSIVATPQGDQANDSCGTLTLKSDGTKSASAGTDCW